MAISVERDEGQKHRATAANVVSGVLRKLYGMGVAASFSWGWLSFVG